MLITRLSFLFLLLFLPLLHHAQMDADFVRKIYDEALQRGKAYEDLRVLCKTVGARLSGSAQAEIAVEWGYSSLKKYGFDTVYKQAIMVPHWERGTKENAWIVHENGQLEPLPILALGGSVATNGLLRAQVVVFSSIDELKKATQKEVQGKIVLINQPMDERFINTFKAYGSCYTIRSNGAVEAGKLGAKAVLIRSLSLAHDDHPHTGSMHYENGIEKIPAAALSTRAADRLAELAGKEIRIAMELNCRNLPDKASFNVIAELRGKKDPNSIITFGGHLDSWDVGEGAHDDGAGVVHAMEALRILKLLGYRPNYTLRVVFFMNEENGNYGGKAYAEWSGQRKEKHLAALESDRGGFVPRGFSCDGNEAQVAFMQSFGAQMKAYELHDFEKGYGGVDISPLKNVFPGIPLFGFVTDSQRYFDVHHAASDVFESVNRRELELGAAAVAAFIYFLDGAL